MAYERFTTSITKSNNLFSIQVDVARKMAELDTSESPFVIRELDTKIETLQAFIDKMEDLTNELIIHMSSNKKDNDDIHNLFNDMDDLIDSVKDY
jgi:paraquat-inducible protein B